jgi:hypothetical protein
VRSLICLVAAKSDMIACVKTWLRFAMVVAPAPMTSLASGSASSFLSVALDFVFSLNDSSREVVLDNSRVVVFAR